MIFVLQYQKKIFKFSSIVSNLHKKNSVNCVRFIQKNICLLQLENKQFIDQATLERKERLKSISQALKLYLHNLNDYEKMMEKEKTEFELGKRHLANIMGWPVNFNITQMDVDKAIEYLFPSGLTDKKALPVMKPPEEIIPKFKKMEFDEDCRPKDFLFYTIYPKFYGLMSKINENTQNLLNFYDEKILKKTLKSKNSINKTKNNESKLILVGSEWLSKEALTKKLGERITDNMYANYITAIDYLSLLPHSHLFTDFIMDNRQTLAGDLSKVLDRKIFGCKIPITQLDPIAEHRFAIGCGKVKKMMYNVKVNDKGSGKFFIDGQHYSEVRSLLAREILLAPLIVTDLLGKVDIDAKLVKNVLTGPIIVARTIRHGTSLALASLFPEFREKLRLAGLLTWDPRKKERAKINQPGARAKWIWKKR